MLNKNKLWLLAILLVAFFYANAIQLKQPTKNMVVPDSLKIGFELKSWFGVEKYDNIKSEYVHFFESYFKTYWKKDNLSIKFYPGYIEERNKLKAIIKELSLEYKLDKHLLAFRAYDYGKGSNAKIFAKQVNHPLHSIAIDSEYAFKGLEYSYNNAFKLKLGSNAWNMAFTEFAYKYSALGFDIEPFLQITPRDQQSNRTTFNFGIEYFSNCSKLHIYGFTKYGYMLKFEYGNEDKQAFKTFTEFGYNLPFDFYTMASYYRYIYDKDIIDRQRINFYTEKGLTSYLKTIVFYENYQQLATNFKQNTYKLQFEFEPVKHIFLTSEFGIKRLSSDNNCYFMGLQTKVEL